MPIKLLAGIYEVLNSHTIPHRPASEKYKEFTTIKIFVFIEQQGYILRW